MLDDVMHQLRDRLAALPGVEHVFIDPSVPAACLLLRADEDPTAAHRAALAVAGDDVLIEVVFRPTSRDRERVRFIGLDRVDRPESQVEIRVTLEWAGEMHTRAATGERGGPIELRTVALATLAAIGAFLPPDLQLRLAGVKQVRAFDAELIVVSIYRQTDGTPRNFVGAVVMGDDARRAAATAVLSALNRLLGNYLFRT